MFAGSIPAASIFGRLAAHMAFVLMLSYGHPSGFRVYVEAAVARAGCPRARLCSRLVDRGGRDTFLDRVPDLAPGWARPCKARREFRDRLARAECTRVSARPSSLRQGRAFRPLRQSDGFRQGVPSGLVACLPWRLPASDDRGVRVRVPGNGRCLAPASGPALTSSTWVATWERDKLRTARLSAFSHCSNRPPPLLPQRSRTQSESLRWRGLAERRRPLSLSSALPASAEERFAYHAPRVGEGPHDESPPDQVPTLEAFERADGNAAQR